MKLIGHRGARAIDPENTMRSIKLAINANADIMFPKLIRTTGDLVRGAHEHGIAVYPWIIYNPESAAYRAIRLMPNIDIKNISDAGHGISMDQPEIVNKSILNFLNK